jgi:hypothetical protein
VSLCARANQSHLERLGTDTSGQLINVEKIRKTTPEMIKSVGNGKNESDGTCPTKTKYQTKTPKCQADLLPRCLPLRFIKK